METVIETFSFLKVVNLNFNLDLNQLHDFHNTDCWSLPINELHVQGFECEVSTRSTIYEQVGFKKITGQGKNIPFSTKFEFVGTI